MGLPDKFVICAWRFRDGRLRDTPIYEQTWPDAHGAAVDLFEGQIDDLHQAVEIDLASGTSRDVTFDVFAEAAAISFNRDEEPGEGLARDLADRGIEFFGSDRREREFLDQLPLQRRIEDLNGARAERGRVA